MNKIIYIFIIGILCCSNILALEYYSGEVNTLYTIPKCQGPIKLKVITNSDITNFQFERCLYDNNSIWFCNCNDNFNVNLLIENLNKNINFDIKIEYYSEYDSNLDEIYQDSFLYNYDIKNIKIIPKKETQSYNFNLNENVLFIVFGIVLFVISIIIFILRHYYFKYTDSDNDDVLNYINK